MGRLFLPERSRSGPLCSRDRFLYNISGASVFFPANSLCCRVCRICILFSWRIVRVITTKTSPTTYCSRRPPVLAGGISGRWRWWRPSARRPRGSQSSSHNLSHEIQYKSNIFLSKDLHCCFSSILYLAYCLQMWPTSTGLTVEVSDL